MAQTLTISLCGSERGFDRHADRIRSFALANGLQEQAAFKITLALDELVTNAFEHGRQPANELAVDISLVISSDEITIQYADNGMPFNPLSADAPEVHLPPEDRMRQVGGMGIHIIKNCMDEVSYERDGGKNILTLRRRRPGRNCGEDCTNDHTT